MRFFVSLLLLTIIALPSFGNCCSGDHSSTETSEPIRSGD